MEKDKIRKTTQKDIKSNHPDNPDLYDLENHEYPLENLTLDNLKALKRKMYDFWKSSFGTEDPDTENFLNAYLKYGNEIKRRLKYINKPVDEDYGYSHNVSSLPDENTMNKPTIKEYKDASTRMKAILTSDTDRSLKLIYQLVRNEQIQFSEFEDLLSEVFYKVYKNLK